MLVLDLGVEEEAVVEFVAEIEDRPLEVGLVDGRGTAAVLQPAVEVPVHHLAVAADRQAVAAAVDLGRRRPHAVGGTVGGDRGLAELQRLDLLRQHPDLALELVQPLSVGTTLCTQRLDFGPQRRDLLFDLGEGRRFASPYRSCHDG